MKKIVSLMALCAVLFGAVLMVTGCGKKPGSDSVTLAKGTVWEITSGELKGAYYCFHSDGHLYLVRKAGNMLGKSDIGTYSFDSKNITVDGHSEAYTLKGDTLTVGSYTMKKVSSPTEAEITKAYNVPIGG